MSFEVSFQGFDQLAQELKAMGDLGVRNGKAAVIDTANEAREILRAATVGPKSGMVAGGERGEIAEAWRVIETRDGALVNNSNEIAAYLEYGVGIYNEGPGLKGPIVPRVKKFLSWIGSDGKRIFAKSVQGFKGTAMVRNNLPRIRKIFENNVLDAVDATLDGRSYG